MMSVITSVAQQTQVFMNSLFVRYKLAQALFLAFFVAEFVSLGLVTATALKFGIDLLTAFLVFVALSAVNTFSFLLAFSYFLYNIVRPRIPRRRY